MTPPEADDESSERSGPGRREARERAVELIFEADAKTCTPNELLDDLPAAPVDYTAEVVAGVGDHWVAINGVIDTYADGWTINRMPAVDRALLRLAVYELLHRDDVPTAVVLDEAVELAKEYSTENSARFVNGLLAAVAAAHR